MSLKIPNSKASPNVCTIQSSFCSSLPLRKVFPVPNLDKLCRSATHKLRAAREMSLHKPYLFRKAECLGCSEVRKIGCPTEKPFLFQQAALNTSRDFCPPPPRNNMRFSLHCREAVDHPWLPLMTTHRYHQPSLQKRRQLQPIPKGRGAKGVSTLQNQAQDKNTL